MYKFNLKSGEMTVSNGGYSSEGRAIKDTFVTMSDEDNLSGMQGMIYEPVEKCERSKVGIVIMHSNVDYTVINMGPELAKRGYVTFQGHVTSTSGPHDNKFKDVDAAIRCLKAVDGIQKVIIMGHSGGATLMTAYQRIAENGVKSVKGDDMLYKCTLPDDTVLTPADGIMCIDANYGNGAMTLMSIDPAVLDETSGMKVDPAFHVLNPESGFTPVSGAKYSDEFLDKFFAAQAKRNNEIIDRALAALDKIEKGEGPFRDDMSFCVVAGHQAKPCNKLINQDLSLVGHTKAVHKLLHKDGSVTEEIVKCRRPQLDLDADASLYDTAYAGSLRTYFDEHAVRALPNYRITECGVEGIDWDHTYNCGPGNIKFIHCPSLFVGLTGGYEYLASEILYDNSPAEDKDCAFVEGADHNFYANAQAEAYPGEFGDTEKVLYDYQAQWLDRFVK